jgi:peptidoglycan/LPS O-acetylase OafA/YrhL
MAASAVSDGSGQRRHLDTLDGLRGFAALSVCLEHLTGGGVPPFRWEAARWLFSWGWAGVDIFFVISGFIIPYTMMRDGYRLRDYGRFVGRRLLRVGPPSWIVAVATVAAFFAVDAIRGTGPFWSAGMSWPRFFHNLAYTIPFTHYAWINLIFWTLAVEFQFYLLVGLAFPLAFRGKWFFVAVAVALCLLPYAPLPAGLIFMRHVTLFLMGGAALLHHEGRLGRPGYLALLAAIVFVAYWQVGAITAAFGGATALIISFVRTRSRLGGFLGRISYPLYLVHPLVGAGTALILMRLVQPANAPAKLLVILAALAASLVVAWLFHRTAEVYFIRLARRAFGRRGAAEAGPPL